MLRSSCLSLLWLVSFVACAQTNPIPTPTTVLLAKTPPAAITATIQPTLPPTLINVAASPTHAVLSLAPTREPIENVLWELAWSPDGKLLAGVFRSGMVLYDSATQQVVGKIPTHGAESPAFSADGKRVACLCGEGVLQVFDLAGNLQFELRDEMFFTASAFSPDGKWLAAGNRDGLVRIWKTETQELAVAFPILRGTRSDARELSFGADSKTILAGSDAFLGEFDVSTGKLLKSYDTVGFGIAAGGNKRMVMATIHEFDGLMLFDRETFKPRQTLKESNRMTRFTASPDGKRVVCACDGELVFWDMNDGKLLGKIHDVPPHIFALAVSPDSKRLAIGTAQGELVVMRMP